MGVAPQLQPADKSVFRNTTERQREMDSYTQHMPVLQWTTFWSDYMSGLKGTLAARSKVKDTVVPSLFSQYRAVDVTMYDLIYGSHSQPRPEVSGYDHYRPLHTSIYGRGRTSHHSHY